MQLLPHAGQHLPGQINSICVLNWWHTPLSYKQFLWGFCGLLAVKASVTNRKSDDVNKTCDRNSVLSEMQTLRNKDICQQQTISGFYYKCHWFNLKQSPFNYHIKHCSDVCDIGYIYSFEDKDRWIKPGFYIQKSYSDYCCKNLPIASIWGYLHLDKLHW